MDTNKMKRYMLVFLFAFLFTTLGCGLSGSTGDGPSNLEVARGWYEETTTLEIQTTGAWRALNVEKDQLLLGLLEQNSVAQECIQEAEEALSNIVLAQPRPVEGQSEAEEIGFAVDALVINQNYPGDILVCQEIRQELARQVVAFRTRNGNLYREHFDRIRELEMRYRADILTDIKIDTWNLVAEQVNQALGIGQFQDFQVPTYNLRVVVRDQEMCAYYTAQEVNGHCEWNAGLGVGTLMGQAAMDFMSRPPMSELGQQMHDSGIEQELDFGDDN